MSELNFELLQENIRALLKKHDLTQSELATIAGMSQGNFSKALNPEEKKQFTLEQLYRIAQHFGVSIDALVGNTSANEITTGPRAVLRFLVQLLCEAKVRVVNISEEERNAFMADVTKAAKAIHAAFHPDKLNYGAYGDTGCHLHMHLVPKYEGGDEWGGTFQMNPGKVYLSDAEYAEMIEKIRANL